MSVLPPQMLRRWPPMVIWLAGAGYSAFNSPELMATTVLFALLGTALTVGIYALWGPRTRPKRNAFWFLVHVLIVGGLIVLVGARPLLGLMAAVPVSLMWLHDTPSSPTTMLVWGMALVLWQPDLWSGAEADIAWTVMMATILFIAASQFERNRLAARQFTQAGIVFSLLRILAVTAISMLFIAGRTTLRAINVFTYVGLDATGVAGKVAMLAIVAACIVAAAALFRVRPERAPRPVVTTASRHARGVPDDPRGGPIDFDEPNTRATQRAADRRVDQRSRPAAAKAKPGKPAPRASQSGRQHQAARQPPGGRQPSTRQPPAARPAKPRPQKAAPGELDFD